MQIRDYYPFRNTLFIQHLHIFSYVFMALSILYLIAANWLMLPDSIQLIIPPVILLITAWVSVKKTLSEGVRQTLHGICGLMVGLSLAVIGQVYQTGADSYLLFLIWTLLLLPWLYRPNIGIFALICITSQLTLFLFLNRLSGQKNFPIFIFCSKSIKSCAVLDLSKEIYGFTFYFYCLVCCYFNNRNDSIPIK